MTILYLLIPVAILMGLVALATFLWSVKSGQYEDLAGAAERVLFDEDPPAAPVKPEPSIAAETERMSA